jgi:hypothetical protein
MIDEGMCHVLALISASLFDTDTEAEDDDGYMDSRNALTSR